MTEIQCVGCNQPRNVETMSPFYDTVLLCPDCSKLAYLAQRRIDREIEVSRERAMVLLLHRIVNGGIAETTKECDS